MPIKIENVPLDNYPFEQYCASKISGQNVQVMLSYVTPFTMGIYYDTISYLRFNICSLLTLISIAFAFNIIIQLKKLYTLIDRIPIEITAYAV